MQGAQCREGWRSFPPRTSDGAQSPTKGHGETPCRGHPTWLAPARCLGSPYLSSLRMLAWLSDPCPRFLGCFTPFFPAGSSPLDNPHPSIHSASIQKPPGGAERGPITAMHSGGLAGHYLGGERWLGALFCVLFTPPRGTEEFSVQESRALAPLPRHMKAAEQTGGRGAACAPLAPAGFRCGRPRCQLLHKQPAQLGAVLGALFFFSCKPSSIPLHQPRRTPLLPPSEPLEVVFPLIRSLSPGSVQLAVPISDARIPQHHQPPPCHPTAHPAIHQSPALRLLPSPDGKKRDVSA